MDKNEIYFALQIIRNQIGQYVYPVHRLDRPTSGVLLFALSPEIARLMGEAFTNKTIQKTYYALVRGYLLDSETIDYPLIKRHSHSSKSHHNLSWQYLAKRGNLSDEVTFYDHQIKLQQLKYLLFTGKDRRQRGKKWNDYFSAWEQC